MPVCAFQRPKNLKWQQPITSKRYLWWQWEYVYEDGRTQWWTSHGPAESSVSVRMCVTVIVCVFSQNKNTADMPLASPLNYMKHISHVHYQKTHPRGLANCSYVCHKSMHVWCQCVPVNWSCCDTFMWRHQLRFFSSNKVTNQAARGSTTEETVCCSVLPRLAFLHPSHHGFLFL